jgi:hypothetical protein
MDLINVCIAIYTLLRWVAVGIYLRVRQQIRAQAAHGWPVAAAIVQSVTTSEDAFHGVRIEYEYSANGQFYGGVLERDFLLGRSARQFRESVIPRATYFVHYDPNHPERSFFPPHSLAAVRGNANASFHA